MNTMQYDFMRESIRTGDRLEFAAASAVGNIIRFCTKKVVNHTALALSITEYTEHTGKFTTNYCGNRKFVLEANAPGIELTPISRIMAGLGKSRVFYTPLIATDEQCRKMADWALGMVGTKYDYGSLLKNIFGRVNTGLGRFFCSEFYFCSLVFSGILPQFHIQNTGVYDLAGKPVKAPRPGEFDQFKVFGATIEIIP